MFSDDDKNRKQSFIQEDYLAQYKTNAHVRESFILKIKIKKRKKILLKRLVQMLMKEAYLLNNAFSQMLKKKSSFMNK